MADKQLCYIFSSNTSFGMKVAQIIHQAAATLNLSIKIIKYSRLSEAEKHFRRDIMQHIGFAIIDLANDADDRAYFKK